MSALAQGGIAMRYLHVLLREKSALDGLGQRMIPPLSCIEHAAVSLPELVNICAF